jgi:hypothetical protein
MEVKLVYVEKLHLSIIGSARVPSVFSNVISKQYRIT